MKRRTMKTMRKRSYYVAVMFDWPSVRKTLDWKLQVVKAEEEDAEDDEEDEETQA